LQSRPWAGVLGAPRLFELPAVFELEESVLRNPFVVQYCPTNSRRESMKRAKIIGLILFGAGLTCLIPRLSQPVSGRAASSMDTPHIGEGGLPQFQVDPDWPKLPSKWRMGFGSAASID